MTYLSAFIISTPAILIATTAHEYTRAMVSISLGDELPKTQKRNTLNPINHFEPVGFILLFFSGGFGWGKPVETSNIRYKDRKRDTLLVSILPSVVNLIIALLATILYRNISFSNILMSTFFVYLSSYNIGLALYNLLPVAPMDCSKVLSVLLPANKYYQYLQQEKMIQFVFLFLIFLGWARIIISPITDIIMKLFETIVSIL